MIKNTGEPQPFQKEIAKKLAFETKIKPDVPVRVLRVSKSFGVERVLKHVTVDFAPKQIHGIIGRNGSGKTVLLKCICGFLKCDTGKICVFGQEVGKDRDFSPNTGMLIERPGFLPYESARKNLRWLARFDSVASLSEVDEVISLVGLDPTLKKAVSKYSLGMLQKLGIAQALLASPDLLILDEPMTALDKHSVIKMRQLFLSLKEQGKTIIIASHFAQDIEELCDTVYEMDEGILTQVQ